jgi:hypothetical protein
MDYRIIFRIFILTIFISCQDKNEVEIKVLDVKSDIITLHGNIEFPVITKFAADIIEIDSLLIVITPFSRDGIFTVFSKYTGIEKCTFSKRGNGPGEYIQPSIHKAGSNIVSLWDTNKRFSEVCLKPDEKSENKFILLSSKRIDQGGMNVYRFNNELMISTIHPDKGMFAFFNNKGEITGDYFGNMPIKNAFAGYDRFQGLIGVSDRQNLFVFGTYDLGYLCSYKIDEMNNPVLKWEFFIHQKPFYKITNHRLIWDEEKHVQGIKGIQLVNNKIIVLYSGKPISLPRNKPEGAFSDKLYLLDTKGNILKKYELDIPVLKIHYSERDMALYGITLTDDWQIVKFNLSL